MEVLALVGPSGSGKSYRASIVANEYGADLIIDDGLLIKDSKILAGRSAKREPSMMAAVRRAIFFDPRDAAEAKAKIREVQPQRILILGTSNEMVDKITDALGLPRPATYLNISEVATKEEIRRAIRIRREQGKHVIPAPTFEVKKTFSGYLVDPLKFFLRSRAESQKPVLIEKSVVRPTFSSLGKFVISDSVVMAIAARAARETDGVKRVTKVYVEGMEEGVTIDLDVAVLYGSRIFEVLQAAQKRVKEAVEYMTALNVLSVTVRAKKLSLD